MSRRARRRLAWIAVAAVVVAAIAGAVLVVDRDDHATPAAPPPTTTTTRPAPTVPTRTTRPPARTSPVLAVKIDNVSAARPQTGLGTADVLYVEPVEGGLTRLLAIYDKPPSRIGPVRSARRTDIQLLAQYGRPVLAYSGAAPELLPGLHHANLVNASPDQAEAAFRRDYHRPAPHNLYVRPSRLPKGAQPPKWSPLAFGTAPPAGVPTGHYRVDYPTATYTLTWSARHHRWLVALDGTALTDTESGQLRVATVVCQRVKVSTSEPIEDANGAVSPVARTVGTGPAVVLRDGRRFAGTWSRPAPNAPTRLRTTTGRDLPLAAGPVLILLVPA